MPESAFARRLGGLVRLVHPFPVLLDALITAVIALVAGADAPTALRLGLAMLGLQASIGALNDVVDTPADAISKPAKPIPRGLVTTGQGKLVAAAGAVLGLGLAAPSGLVTLFVASLILVVGYGYDLRAKGTLWSWLPFTLGIPLLPVFAWLGTRGDWPDAFTIMIPTAVAAGAGLAVANARADVEGDIRAGVGSIAVELGLERSWLLNVALLAGVITAALVSLAARAAPTDVVPVGAASAIVLAGVGFGWRGSARRRELAWEIQAMAVALLAVAWLKAWGPLD